MLDQLREGLKTLGVLEDAIKFPLQFESLFVKTDIDLNSDEVKAILEFPEDMNKDGMDMKEMLMKFLDDCQRDGKCPCIYFIKCAPVICGLSAIQ